MIAAVVLPFILFVALVSSQSCNSNAASPWPTTFAGTSIIGNSACTLRDDSRIFPTGYSFCIIASVNAGYVPGDGLVSIQSNYNCYFGPNLIVPVTGQLFGQQPDVNATFFAHNLNYIVAINATNDGGTGSQISGLQFVESAFGTNPFFGSPLTVPLTTNYFAGNSSIVALSFLSACVPVGSGSIFYVGYNWLPCQPFK